MDEELMWLAEESRSRQEIGMVKRDDGTVLFVYPAGDGAAVGVGTEPGCERKLRALLRKRSENLPRYGAWLPALFGDGSCFVITRMRDAQAGIDADSLAAARELIA